MRMVLMLVSVLIVSLLIFKGYSSNLTPHNSDSQSETTQMTPQDKARDVNRVILESTQSRQNEIEKQVQ